MTPDTEAGAVPPALTAAEWTEFDADRLRQFAAKMAGEWGVNPDGAMALANAARADADPGKLTWAMVDEINKSADDEIDAADSMEAPPHPRYHVLRAAADAIAALLQPREGA